MHRRLILLCVVLSFAASLSASPVHPSSYTIGSDPWGYLDSGGELTDGLYQAVIPGHVDNRNLGVPDSSRWVGWSNNDPIVTFHFLNDITVRTITIDTARWEEAAVYLPAQVEIGSDVFAINPNNYADLNKVALVFNGSWTGADLTLHLTKGVPYPGFAWTFMDEVTFDSTQSQSAPEGGTLEYLGLALVALGFIVRRLRSRA